MSSQQHLCTACGHQSSIYTQRLTPGCIESLIKLRRAIQHHQRNSIHLYKDMDGTPFELTTSQQMNWTKLRFHGLVAKVKVDGHVQRGYWLLTTRGRQFLDGGVTVPRSVRTLNNRVIDHDELHVGVTDVMESKPHFDDFAFWHETKEPQALNLAQVTLL